MPNARRNVSPMTVKGDLGDLRDGGGDVPDEIEVDEMVVRSSSSKIWEVGEGDREELADDS